MRKQLVISVIAAVIIMAGCVDVFGERRKIDRYNDDFVYQGVEYQILSRSKKTAAVAQEFDLDFNLFKDPPESKPEPQPINISPYKNYYINPNGYEMELPLLLNGIIIDIPQTVYDENGTAYTVTDLAEGAINWVSIGMLILPPTLKRLNGGIVGVNVSEIYLPDGLKEIDGIMSCRTLSNLHIPRSVEVIRKNSLWGCGFEELYLPPSVKILEDGVLQECKYLRLVKLSAVETMGKECLKGCPSYAWAILPETLRTMGEGCFDDCTNLAEVALPWREIKMDGCFNGCPSIKRIAVLATEPYPFPDNSFRDVDRTMCTLAVPEGSEEKYRNADGWKEFRNIVGELPATYKPKRGSK